MPITQAKHLELLAAGEDALQGLANFEELILRQFTLADASQQWEPLFRELVLLAQTEYMLQQPAKTRLTIQLERQFYSPTRLGINRRAKQSQARRRGKSPLPVNGDAGNDDA